MLDALHAAGLSAGGLDPGDFLLDGEGAGSTSGPT